MTLLEITCTDSQNKRLVKFCHHNVFADANNHSAATIVQKNGHPLLRPFYDNGHFCNKRIKFSL